MFTASKVICSSSVMSPFIDKSTCVCSPLISSFAVLDPNSLMYAPLYDAIILASIKSLA